VGEVTAVDYVEDDSPIDWRAALGLERGATVGLPEPVSGSVMLQGYASAMHSLGEKYEAGRGVYRNEREAVRCYFKAAKLGNEEAQERLAERGIVPKVNGT
jgi:TPR repeat protein